MHAHNLIRSLCASALLCSASFAGWTSRTNGDLARLAPRDTLVFVEADGLDELFEQGLDHPAIASFLHSELGQRLLESMDVSPAQWLSVVEVMLGFPLLPTLAELTSGGVSLALAPRGGRASFALVARTHDADLLEDTVLDVVGLATRKARRTKGWAPVEASETLAGASVWRLENAHLGLAGDTLVLARDRALLREILTLRGDPSRTSLADDEGFAAAREAALPGDSGGALAWGVWNIDATERIADDGLRGLRQLPRLPQVQMLLGAGIGAIGSAERWTVALSLDEHGLRANGVAHGVEPGVAGVLLPDAGDATRVPPAPERCAGDVATALLHRDVSELLARRTDLFDVRYLPKFSEALSNLALFFGGAEVETEILPHLSPWVRVIAREVDFDETLAPGIPLPAVALLIDVDEVESIGFELEAGFQTMVGLINVDRAQQAKPPLRMQLERLGDVQMTRAHFLAPRHGERGLDMRYNLEPACALVGRTFVLGTHAKLVAELSRELAAGPTAPAAGAPALERLEVTAASVAELLTANREALVMNAILEEGKSREKAEDDLAWMIAIARWLRGLTLELSYAGDEAIGLSAHMTWKRAN